jgi:hypothetical protein
MIAPRGKKRQASEAQDSSIFFYRVALYATTHYSKLLREEMVKVRDSQIAFFDELNNDRRVSKRILNSVVDSFEQDVSAQVKTSADVITKELQQCSQLSEGLLLAQRHSENQLMYLFLHLLSCEGTYTSHPHNVICFWFPVLTTLGELRLAVCRELLVLHILWLVVSINRKEKVKSSKSSKGKSLKSLKSLKSPKYKDVDEQCCAFLSAISDLGGSFSADTKKALDCAWRCVPSPKIYYVTPSVVLDMYTFMKDKERKFGITGIPHVFNIQRSTLSTLLTKTDIPFALDDIKTKIRLEIPFELQGAEAYVGTIDSNQEMLPILPPMSLSKEVVSKLAFRPFFEHALFKTWNLKMDLKMDPLKMDPALNHMGPSWRMEPTEVQPWTKEFASSIGLSSGLLELGWTLRKRCKEDEWNAQKKELQAKWNTFCQEKSVHPAIQDIPREFTSQITV